MLDDYVGKKVTIHFPHYCKIERVLKQNQQGLFVSYQNQRCSVRPDKNCLGEFIKGHFTGIHPKLVKLNKN